MALSYHADCKNYGPADEAVKALINSLKWSDINIVQDADSNGQKHFADQHVTVLQFLWCGI